MLNCVRVCSFYARLPFRASRCVVQHALRQDAMADTNAGPLKPTRLNTRGSDTNFSMREVDSFSRHIGREKVNRAERPLPENAAGWPRAGRRADMEREATAARQPR